MALTKLENMVNPQVLADMISAELPKFIRFAPLAEIDNTLSGRPGSKITLPKYIYSGDATVVAEGANIPIDQLTTSTVDVEIHKIGKALKLTDESILSGYGDPMGEATQQMILSLANKEDNEMLSVLRAISGVMVHECEGTTLDATDVSNALVKFGEKIDGTKYLVICSADLAKFRTADWIPASEIAAELRISGVVGQVYGCLVILSDKVKQNNAFIVKPGALKLFMKRDVIVEADRDIINKTTVISGDAHYAQYLYKESDAIRIQPKVLDGFEYGPEAGTATVLGKTVSDVQANTSIVGEQAFGTLKYVSSWDAYETGAKGYFFVSKFDADTFSATAGTNTNIYVKVIGGPHSGREVMLDSDKVCVTQITDKDHQYLEVRVKDNANSKEAKYNIYFDQLKIAE